MNVVLLYVRVFVRLSLLSSESNSTHNAKVVKSTRVFKIWSKVQTTKLYYFNFHLHKIGIPITKGKKCDEFLGLLFSIRRRLGNVFSSSSDTSVTTTTVCYVFFYLTL